VRIVDLNFEIPSASGSKMENANVILMKTAVDAAAVQTINSVCHRSTGNYANIAYTQGRK